jgi:hypothetical protein
MFTPPEWLEWAVIKLGIWYWLLPEAFGEALFWLLPQQFCWFGG